MTAKPIKTHRQSGLSFAWLPALAATILSTSASASQTSYAYDALGRLVRVEQTSTRTSYQAHYTYDKAGNRTSRMVQGVAAGVAVVPHAGGYRVIVLKRE